MYGKNERRTAAKEHQNSTILSTYESERDGEHSLNMISKKMLSGSASPASPVASNGSHAEL